MQEGMDEWERKALASEKDVQRYLRALSRQYVRQMSNGKRAFEEHDGPKIMINYDDLRTDTLRTMRDLCAALGLPVDEQRLSQVVDRHSFENIPSGKEVRANSTVRLPPAAGGKISPRSRPG